MIALDTRTAGANTLDDATRFIWAEAEMLDRLAYAEWLRLWSPDGMYIIPIDRDAADPANALNVVYDDHAMREARVRRLSSGFSMSAAPPARTVRTLSRFVVAQTDTGGMTVRAAQIIAEYKYERTRVLAADVQYDLVTGEGGLRLKRKTVMLANADNALHGIGYLL